MRDGTHGGWRRRACAAVLWGGLLGLLGLQACSPSPPIKLGFLGGLSNQASSFSDEGRNGAMLAVEQRNRAGGVGGRQIELVVQDYGDGAGLASAAFRALREAGVTAVIGPYSSTAAAELDPVVDAAKVLLLSPISRAGAVPKQGGFLLRVGRMRRSEIQAVAAMLHARGIRRTALASDVRSAAYSSSWVADFREAFMALGGEAAVDVPFGQEAELQFSAIARRLLSSQPQAVVFVSSGVDAARLAQQVARLAPALPMTASGRAINTALLELGGQALEGMVLVQPYNAADTSPRFRAFHDAYAARFGQGPTYSAMVSFDAVNMLADALARRRPEESPRDALLQHGPYPGLQETIRFDGVGGAARRAYFSVVRDGRLEPVP